jgi:hypothetical protein
MVIRYNEYRWCCLDDAIQRAIIGLTCVAQKRETTQVSVREPQDQSYAHGRVGMYKAIQSISKPLSEPNFLSAYTL